jgi:hypothetical protein
VFRRVLWWLPRREAIELALDLRYAGQLHLQFLQDFLDLGREFFYLAVAGWAGWAGFPAWASRP